MEGELCAYCFQSILNGEGRVRFKMVGRLEWKTYHRRRDDSRRIDCWDRFLTENPTIRVIEKREVK
mgnify:CR=1 FL=1